MFTIFFLFLWRESGLGRLLMWFLGHTIRHTHPVGFPWTSDQPVAETATFTTHNKHKWWTSTPSAGFEPATPKNRAADDICSRPHGNIIHILLIRNCKRSSALYIYIYIYIYIYGDRGGTVVKVLCYKSESRWFDPSWCQCIFLWHKILPIALWPWGRLSL